MRYLKLYLVVSLVLVVSGTTMAITIGPATLPDWEADAQTKLGWEFINPKDPGATPPISPGWDRYVGGGAPPQWDYDAGRVDPWGGDPAQWKITIPNLEGGPVKHFWLSYVYEFITLTAGTTRIHTNIEWFPDAGYGNYADQDEWFDAAGNPTQIASDAAYGRWTMSLDMYPNPSWEAIWIGMAGDPASGLMEAYVVAQCIPEPLTMLAVGMGIAGLAGYVRKRNVPRGTKASVKN